MLACHGWDGNAVVQTLAGSMPRPCAQGAPGSCFAFALPRNIRATSSSSRHRTDPSWRSCESSDERTRLAGREQVVRSHPSGLVERETPLNGMSRQGSDFRYDNPATDTTSLEPISRVFQNKTIPISYLHSTKQTLSKNPSDILQERINPKPPPSTLTPHHHLHPPGPCPPYQPLSLKHNPIQTLPHPLEL